MSSPALAAFSTWLAQLVLALAITPILFNSTYAQSGPVQSSGGPQPISPAVVAAWSAHADQFGAVVLDFLVLLRGEPGWFMGSESSGYGSSKHVLGESPPFPSVLHMSYGIHNVKLRFDPTKLTLTVQNEVVSLQAVNVVLVDGVDSADGVRIENVFWLDRSCQIWSRRRSSPSCEGNRQSSRFSAAKTHSWRPPHSGCSMPSAIA